MTVRPIELPGWYCVVIAAAIVALTGLALFCDVARSSEAGDADRWQAKYETLDRSLRANCVFYMDGSVVCRPTPQLMPTTTQVGK